MLPEQFLTETGRYREPVVAADQRMVIRRFRDDLPGFVHDVFHCDASNPMRRNRPGIGSSDAAALWHAERKLYLGSTVKIADALHYAVRIRISFTGIHYLSRLSRCRQNGNQNADDQSHAQNDRHDPGYFDDGSPP